VNALQIAIAAVPLAVYFLLMGSLRLRNRPLVTSGWRDMLTLGIACSGLVAVGPMQLFFPTHAASIWPGWVWVPMFGLYILGVLVLTMWSRPRLIAYGMSKQQFQQLLLNAAQSIDPNASWFGEVLSLPNCGLQLSAESTLGHHVNSVGIVGTLQNLPDWIKLEQQFVRMGSQSQCASTRSGWLLVIAGIVLLILTLSPVVQDPAMALAELSKLLFR
jgi:hypothetical protein